jgi:citrate synthase
MTEDQSTKIGRPRQIYSGETVHDYVPLEERA